MAKIPRTPQLNIELTSELIEESKERDSSHCTGMDLRKPPAWKRGIKPGELAEECGIRYVPMELVAA